MLIIVLLKGILLGFLAAVPVGPIGALCIERTLNHGRRCGFISGLGAAAADGVYSAVAAFSITAISVFVLDHQIAIRLIGGILLLWMGIKAFKNVDFDNRPVHPPDVTQQTSDFASTFFLTLTNPTTILAFGVLFGVLNFHFKDGIIGPLTAVLGVFIGSSLWWLILSTLVDHFIRKMKRFSVGAIKRSAAGLVIISAAFILASLAYNIRM